MSCPTNLASLARSHQRQRQRQRRQSQIKLARLVVTLLVVFAGSYTTSSTPASAVVPEHPAVVLTSPPVDDLANAQVAEHPTASDTRASQRPTSTTPMSRSVATEAEQAFFRGAKPGEAPSFSPRPNEFKVDADGLVKPTHGVSVFDNPTSVSSKGFVPHEIDMATVPSELRIIQRGNDLRHFEIVPQIGSGLTPARFGELLCRIGCKS